ncbi:MFS transporter [Photobacterium aquae]|uniref:MFS transporter n=1 Tax=Photobacterium aquae TaxID=1195763 RepID=A0A0J1GWM2_9GAMM|nr:peptide MFS transporter [Photobacterium aquae]KLV03814.1 MFS transporter [Photobacterium aquae]
MQDANSRLPFTARLLILRQFLWGAAFYGTYVLLTRFFLEELEYSEAETIMMMGAFGAVGPVFSAVGGFVADRFIGSFRAVYIGYTTYTIGFFILGYGASTLNVPLSIFAIALIGYARGLSATSPTVLLGNSYSETNRDAFQQGLTVNYSINNLGSFSSKYLFPFMVAFLAYQGNFYIASALISLTLVLFVVFRERFIAVGNDIDRRPVSTKVWGLFTVGSALMLGLVFWVFSNLDAGKYLLYGLGVCAIGYFIFEITRATAAFRYKMCSVLIMIFIMIVFYFYYGQMLTSMNIYAINLMGDQLFGLIPIRPESNAAFNPLWCFILGGPVIFVYGWLERKGFSPSIPTKFAAAFIFSAISFSLLGLSTSFVGEGGKISADWILWVHFFQSIAELIVGALGVGFIFEMVPRYLSAFAIGLRSVALSLSGILAAVISTRIALPKDQVLTPEIIEGVYASYFFNLAILAVVMAVITLALSKVIAKLVSKGEELERLESHNEEALTSK